MSNGGEDEAEQERANEWYDRKTKLMEDVLGDEHDMVSHSIFPYAMGGSLDLYYYPNGIEGTAIATKELSELPDEGSTNDVYRNYELVMFTRHKLDLDKSDDARTPFGRAHGTINAVLNCIARYSAEATLNPFETCEFPADMEDVGGKCLVFAPYFAPPEGYDEDEDHEAEGDEERQEFGLLAIVEVFRSEMEFARREGGETLLARLVDAGHFPYSDLDRAPVA